MGILKDLLVTGPARFIGRIFAPAGMEGKASQAGIVDGIGYATCSTAAATAAKVVTISNNSKWELQTGAIIAVKFTVSNTASSVTLNVNGSGAKQIWYNNAVYTSTSTMVTGYANRFVLYMYDGTYWVWLGWSLDSNDNTYDRVRFQNNVLAKSAITSANIIVANDNTGYFHLKTGSTFDLTYPILYAGSSFAAAANSNNTYLTIPLTITTTQALTMTVGKMVYIKGTITYGKKFTPVSTTPLTQTVPTTEDGYMYLLLGYAYTSTVMHLLTEHPVYHFIDGEFRLAYSTQTYQTSLPNTNGDEHAVLFEKGTATTTTAYDGVYKSSKLKFSATNQKIIFHSQTYESQGWNTANPGLRFYNSADAQGIDLFYTDYNSVCDPACLMLAGQQGGEYFIAPNFEARDMTNGNMVVAIRSAVTGTATAIGRGDVVVGNSLASGTAGNASGRVRIYDTLGKCIDLEPVAELSSNGVIKGRDPGVIVVQDETTGGTKLKGTLPEIKFHQTTASKTYDSARITAYPGDTNGINLLVNSGGNTIIGAGESAANFYNLSGKSSDEWNASGEQLFLTSDNNVNIYSNANTIANRMQMSFRNNGKLYVPKGFILTNKNIFADADETSTHLVHYGRFIVQTVGTAATASADSTVGVTRLLLGNGTAAGIKGTTNGANNASGALFMYCNNAYSIELKPKNDLNASRTITLPDEAGELMIRSRGFMVVDAAYDATKPWVKVGTLVLTGANWDSNATFLLTQGYGKPRAGILQIHLRTDGSCNSLGTSSTVEWVCATPEVNPDDFKLVAVYDTTNHKVTCELWLKYYIRYHSMWVMRLDEHARHTTTTAAATSQNWVLSSNASTTAAAPTTGNMTITSTLRFESKQCLFKATSTTDTSTMKKSTVTEADMQTYTGLSYLSQSEFESFDVYVYWQNNMYLIPGVLNNLGNFKHTLSRGTPAAGTGSPSSAVTANIVNCSVGTISSQVTVAVAAHGVGLASTTASPSRVTETYNNIWIYAVYGHRIRV